MEGRVKNERGNIVTRVESTPEKKVRLQGVNLLHSYTRREEGAVDKEM